MKKIKVLMLVSSLRRSGPIIVVQNLLSKIDRNKFDIEIVKLLDDEHQRSITKEFEDEGFKIHELKSSKLLIELFPNVIASKLYKLIKSIDADILHIHGYQCNRVVNHLDIKIPIIETLHCILAEDYRHYGYVLGRYMLNRHLHGLKKISAIVAISEAVKDYCTNINREYRVTRIYNGVKLPEKHSKNETRKLLGFDSDLKIFTVVGSLSSRKDPLTIIRAFKKAFQKNNKVLLLFLGKGPLKQKCRDEIGDDSRIKLLGWKPNVYDYLAASDYSISASHSEGFGLNFIESLAAGTPVIGSNILPFKEFYKQYPQIEDFSFPVGDINMLSIQLHKAINMNIEIEEINSDVRTNFSSLRMAQEYMNLYENYVKSK